MNNTLKIVIDTNVFISALIKKDGLTRNIIIKSNNIFLFPEYEFQEIYKYKDDIIRKSGYSEIEFTEAMTSLLNHVRIVSYEEIGDDYNEACKIMDKIDSGDAIFVATAIALDAFIWSNDKDFKRQDKVKVLSTEDMIEPV